MSAPIVLSMNSDRRSLTVSFRSRFGVTRKISLSAAEVGELIQELGSWRLTMIPPQQFASKPADERASTGNPSVRVVAGPTAGSLILSLLDVKYGWLGFRFQSQSWNALAGQASDALGETDVRSSVPE